MSPTAVEPVAAPGAACNDVQVGAAEREKAIDLYLADHAAEAQVALDAVLKADPRDRAAVVFRDASETKVAAGQQRNAELLQATKPVRLAAIPSTPTAARPIAETGPKLRLEKLSEKSVSPVRDARTDVPSRKDRTLASPFPQILGRVGLAATIRHPDHVVGIYPTQVVIMADGRQPVAFDTTAATRGAVQLETTWAQLVGKTLVVGLAYNGYAKDAGGKNGYFAAFDATTGALAWSTGPLVSNSYESLVSGGTIVTGYGFTAEPDFLFVLDLATGKVEQKIPLKSAPESIRAKGDQIFVGSYDSEAVFRAPGGFVEPTPQSVLGPSEPVAPMDAVARCWVRHATAAVMARDAKALAQASMELGRVSHDRLLDEALASETRRLATPGALDLESAPVVVAPAPPWQERRGPAAATASKAPRLVKTSSHAASPVRNMNPHFVAGEPFFLAPVDQGRLPPGAQMIFPPAYGVAHLHAIIPDARVREPGPPPKDAHTILIYDGRFLALVDDASSRVERVLDLSAYVDPPTKKTDALYAREDATFAQLRDGVLYVCNGGGSYAKEVGGKKGFMSALDATTGALLWRSAPLVCNASFSVAGDQLVTGYGFTDEPDFVFLLRRADGAIVQKVAIPSGPETIRRDGSTVHVESYGHVIDFELR